MNLGRICAAVLLAAISSSPAPAIDKKVTVSDNVFYLSTNTPHGECRSREVADGAIDWICQDEASFAALNTKIGCLDSGGAGYCARNRPGRHGESGSQLNCSGGKDYFPHTGIWDDNNCILQDGRKVCQSTGGKGFAEAACHGCIRTEGAGMCCATAPCELPRTPVVEEE